MVDKAQANPGGQPRALPRPGRRRVLAAAAHAPLLTLPLFSTVAAAAAAAVGVAGVAGVAGGAQAAAARILAVRTWPADEYTRVTLELDAELVAHHFIVTDPLRLVLDLQGLTMSAAINDLVARVHLDDPYIAAVRVAQNRPDVLRLVFELKQWVAPQLFTLKPVGDYQYRLVLDLYPKVAQGLGQDPLLAVLQPSAQDSDPLAGVLEKLARQSATGAGTGLKGSGTDAMDDVAALLAATPPVPTPQTVPKERGSGGSPASSPPPPAAQKPASRAAAKPPAARPALPGADRFLVALDAGHGGEDPGAIGPGGTREKEVALAIAVRLKRLIDAHPAMRAYLTRDKDYFVPLHVRVQKARRVKADLFISIHANASVKSSARGSSIFALSQTGASSTAARLLAQKENEADLIGGLNLGLGGHSKQVQQLLLDLSTTAQISDSLRVGGQLLQRLGRLHRLHKAQVERAGFAVLRAPDIPSVLVETAFISNPAEEKLLRSAAHQEKLAQALLAGIQAYFDSHPALARAKSGAGV